MLVDIIKLSRDLKVNGFTKEAKQVLGLRKLAEDENSMIMADIVDQRLSVDGDPYKFSSRGEESGSVVFRILDAPPEKANLVGKDIVSGVKGYEALTKRLTNSTASPNSMLTDANMIAKTISQYMGNTPNADERDMFSLFNTITEREDESFKRQIMKSLKGIDRNLYNVLIKQLFPMSKEERAKVEESLKDDYLLNSLEGDPVGTDDESYDPLKSEVERANLGIRNQTDASGRANTPSE